MTLFKWKLFDQQEDLVHMTAFIWDMYRKKKATLAENSGLEVQKGRARRKIREECTKKIIAKEPL